MDVGCGCGIFSIIFLLNNNIRVNELVLIDIEENCLHSSYQNFIYNKDKFNINKITIIQSDLFKSLTDNDKYYYYFDIVLANMPQTPSINKIRSIIYI